MTAIIIIGILALLAIVVVQIGKLSDLRSKIMGEEDINYQNYDITGKLLLFFMIGFLIFCVVSAYYYKNWVLGYGPHESASIHGHSIDSMFDTTLIYTGIVFFVTQVGIDLVFSTFYCVGHISCQRFDCMERYHGGYQS